MKSKWSSSEVKFLEDNYKLLSYSEMGRFLGRSYKSISRKAECMGFKKINHKKWSNFEVEYLIKNYSSVPPVKIAKYLNRTYESVTTKAFILGLNVGYRYFDPLYDEGFFNKWSPELAWLVGIVLSDGHISNPSSGKFIRIKMCDKDVIEKIRGMVNYKGNIYLYCPNNPKYKTSYSITLYGDLVWKFFTSLGMSNDKSYNAVFPKTDEKYIIHVIRGVFDGDGSVYLSRNTRYPFARVNGTPSVVKPIEKYIGIHCTQHWNSLTNLTIQYTGVNAIQFLNNIYKFSDKLNRMNRKYNKYLNILEKWGG